MVGCQPERRPLPTAELCLPRRGRPVVAVLLTHSAGGPRNTAPRNKTTTAAQVSRVSEHYVHDAWLPREFVDPFGRSASMMPWDRETKTHILNDARA